MLYDATKKKWQRATWTDEKGEHPCLFTDVRINPDTVPEGKFMYQVRDNECNGDWHMIAKGILVNFWGTILTDEPIDFDSYSDKSVYVTDYNYLDEDVPISLEHSVIEIKEVNKEKMLSFIGYGYCAGNSACTNPDAICRFVEYATNQIPFQEALSFTDENGNQGISAYENNHMSEVKQYIEDLTEKQLLENYIGLRNQSTLFISEEQITKNLPAGKYLVL